jgi:Transposase IS66 family
MRSNLETSARACKIGGRRHQLADATLRAYAYKLDTELDVLLRIAPAHGAGNKLAKCNQGHADGMFVFLANRAIPPTNNGSEQALRPWVIFRKVTIASASHGQHSTPTSAQLSKPDVEKPSELRTSA